MDQARQAACQLLRELMDDVPTRNNEPKAINDANSSGVRFDMLRMVRRLEDKAAVIRELGVDVYIDDQDECLMDIPSEVTVFKIRNDGNFEESKWLYSSRTGTNIEL